MQPDLSNIGLETRQLSWRMSEPAKLWFEQEKPDEIKEVEEAKKRQKQREKQLSDKRKKPEESKQKTGQQA
jgi:hypothetical protein